MPSQDPVNAPNRLKLVCRREIITDPAYFSSVNYQEQVIYFCTEFCLEAFQADPDRFYQAHSRQKAKAVSAQT